MRVEFSIRGKDRPLDAPGRKLIAEHCYADGPRYPPGSISTDT
jgi:hypothetical protein